MGRSSSGGGSSHSSGGGHSGRSSGGSRHSSGSNRSSGYSSSSSSSGYSSSNISGYQRSRTYYNTPIYGRGPVINETNVYRGDGTVRTRGSRSSSISIALSVIVTVAGLLAMVFIVVFSGGVTSSTVKREKLANRLCKEVSNNIQDVANWGVNSSKVKKASDYFYKKTGVQPVLFVSEGLYGNNNATDDEIVSELENIYDNTCSDEGHAAFAYIDFGAGDWGFWWVVGSDARGTLDREACQIIEDYLAKYASSDMDDATYFATVLTKSADRIMKKSAPKWLGYVIVLSIMVVCYIIIFIIVSSIKKKELKIKEMEEANKILNTEL